MRCSNPKCYVTEGVSCPEGKLDLRDCPNFDAENERDDDLYDGILQFGAAGRIHLCTEPMGRTCGPCSGEMDL